MAAASLPEDRSAKTTPQSHHVVDQLGLSLLRRNFREDDVAGCPATVGNSGGRSEFAHWGEPTSSALRTALSWYEFAHANLQDLVVALLPIATQDHPTPARRPRNPTRLQSNCDCVRHHVARLAGRLAPSLRHVGQPGIGGRYRGEAGAFRRDALEAPRLALRRPWLHRERLLGAVNVTGPARNTQRRIVPVTTYITLERQDRQPHIRSGVGNLRGDRLRSEDTAEPSWLSLVRLRQPRIRRGEGGAVVRV